MKLFSQTESDTNQKPAKKGGQKIITTILSDRNKIEYKTLYTGNGKLQVFDSRSNILETINLKNYEN